MQKRCNEGKVHGPLASDRCTGARLHDPTHQPAQHHGEHLLGGHEGGQDGTKDAQRRLINWANLHEQAYGCSPAQLGRDLRATPHSVSRSHAVTIALTKPTPLVWALIVVLVSWSVPRLVSVDHLMLRTTSLLRSIAPRSSFSPASSTGVIGKRFMMATASNKTQWDPEKTPYPKARRDEAFAEKFKSKQKGEVEVKDPYHWLHEPPSQSEETKVRSALRALWCRLLKDEMAG